MLRRHFERSRHGPRRAGDSLRTRAADLTTASNRYRWTRGFSAARRARGGPRLSWPPRVPWRLASVEAPVGTEARKGAELVCCVWRFTLDGDRGTASAGDRAP